MSLLGQVRDRLGLSGNGGGGGSTFDIATLPAAGALAGTDPIPVSQGGTNVQTTLTALAAFVASVLVVTPAGADKQVQFNDAGTLGATAGFTFNKTTVAAALVNGADTLTLTATGITKTGAAALTITGVVNTVTAIVCTGAGKIQLDSAIDAVSTGNAGVFATGGLGIASNIWMGTHLTVDATAAPAVSPVGTGRIYFDSGTNTFRVSQNGGAYGNLVASVAGSDTQVQFNDGGAFGADSGFTYNKTTDTLTLGAAASLSGTALSATGTFAVSGTGGTTISTTISGNISLTVAVAATGQVNVTGSKAATTTTSAALVVTGGIASGDAVWAVGAFAGGVGSVSLPTFTFTSDTSTGLWRQAAGTVSLTCAGTEAIRSSASAGYWTTSSSINFGATIGTPVSTTGTNLNTAATVVRGYSTASSTSGNAGVYGRGEHTASTGPAFGVYGYGLTSAGTGTAYGAYGDAGFSGTTAGAAVGLGFFATSATTTAGTTSYGIQGTVTATGASNAASLTGADLTITGAASSATVQGFNVAATVPNTYTGTTFKGGTITATMSSGTASTTATATGLDVALTVNQGSTLGYTGIKCNVTETATGSGTKNLLALQVGGTDRFTVSSAVVSGFGLATSTVTDSGTATTPNALAVAHNSTGTPTTGFGVSVLFLAHSSTTVNTQVGQITARWATATHASRAGRMTFSLSDSGGSRECARMEVNGTAAMLGFFGANAVVQPATTGETIGFTAGAGTNVTDASTFTGNVGATAYRISDIVKALKNLGLMAS